MRNGFTPMKEGYINGISKSCLFLYFSTIPFGKEHIIKSCKNMSLNEVFEY